MTQIDAIYQNGVFKPLQDVGLTENQRVRLSVEPAEVGDVPAWRAWLARVEERHQRIIAERGYFPDSTLDIAEDRRR
jgi:predicted DNA-binding antitoxin AbrB/MazE fold protein